MSVKDRVARILLVDDHPIVRQGLRQVIDAAEGLEVCGEAESAPEALRVTRDTRPDLTIVDLHLGTSDGLELIKSMRSAHPEVRVLVLTMHDEAFYAERVLRAGARGFLSKQEASDKVIGAIRRILAGEMYVSEKVSPMLLRKLLAGDEGEEDPVDRLSDRELQVFRLIGEGLASQEIADALNLSVKTIETYRAHIKEKLELEDARKLVQSAIRWVIRDEGH